MRKGSMASNQEAHAQKVFASQAGTKQNQCFCQVQFLYTGKGEEVKSATCVAFGDVKNVSTNGAAVLKKE